MNVFLVDYTVQGNLYIRLSNGEYYQLPAKTNCLESDNFVVVNGIIYEKGKGFLKEVANGKLEIAKKELATELSPLTINKSKEVVLEKPIGKRIKLKNNTKVIRDVKGKTTVWDAIALEVNNSEVNLLCRVNGQIKRYSGKNGQLYVNEGTGRVHIKTFIKSKI